MVVFIISCVTIRSLFNEDIPDHAWYFWTVVPSGLIWIWICWRFIK
mgnify:CR=1 FL=1